MYVQRNTIKNKRTGKEYYSVFLCTKYREEGKIKTRVENNLSHLSEEVILSIENTLKSKTETVVKEKDIIVESCTDYGF
jgi:hypothetical protein